MRQKYRIGRRLLAVLLMVSIILQNQAMITADEGAAAQFTEAAQAADGQATEKEAVRAAAESEASDAVTEPETQKKETEQVSEAGTKAESGTQKKETDQMPEAGTKEESGTQKKEAETPEAGTKTESETQKKEPEQTSEAEAKAESGMQKKETEQTSETGTKAEGGTQKKETEQTPEAGTKAENGTQKKEPEQTSEAGTKAESGAQKKEPEQMPEAGTEAGKSGTDTKDSGKKEEKTAAEKAAEKAAAEKTAGETMPAAEKETAGASVDKKPAEPESDKMDAAEQSDAPDFIQRTLVTGDEVWFSGSDGRHHSWALLDESVLSVIDEAGALAKVRANAPGQVYLAHHYEIDGVMRMETFSVLVKDSLKDRLKDKLKDNPKTTNWRPPVETERIHVGETLELVCGEPNGENHVWSSDNEKAVQVRENPGYRRGQKLCAGEVTGMAPGRANITHTYTINVGRFGAGEISVREVTKVIVEEDENRTAEKQRLYCYVLIPGHKAGEGGHANKTWFGVGIGEIEAEPPQFSNRNGVRGNGNFPVDQYPITYPASYPDLTYQGNTYQYADQGSENAYRNDYYTIDWSYVTVAAGANTGKNNYNRPIVPTNVPTYHLNGVLTLNERELVSVHFEVRDPGSSVFSVFGPAAFSQRVAVGTAANRLEKPKAGDIQEYEGYRFDGWYYDEACSREADWGNDTVERNTTFYGRYIPEQTEAETEESETETEVMTEAETEEQTEAETETEDQTEVMTEEQTEAETETEDQTEVMTEEQTEAETEAQTDAMTEEQTEAETETEAVTEESETETEAVTESQTEESETETEAITESQTEESETETETMTEEQTEESETETEAMMEAETEEQTEAETEAEDQTEAMTEEQTEAETEAEDQTEAETETEEQTEESETETEIITEDQIEESETETEAITEDQTEDMTEEQTETTTENQTEIVTERLTEKTEEQSESIMEAREAQSESAPGESEPQSETLTESAPDGEEPLPLPEGYYMAKQLTVTKNMTDAGGNAVTSDETFYAGIFTDAAFTQLADNVSQNIIPLPMGGQSAVSRTAELMLTEADETVFYVTEVDAGGTPVQRLGGFGYDMTVSNMVLTLSQDSEDPEVTIINALPEETKQEMNPQTEQKTDASEANIVPQDAKSVKTGDETPILPFLMAMILAAAVIRLLSARRRKRREDETQN